MAHTIYLLIKRIGVELLARDGFRDDLENDGEEFEVLILIDDEGQEHSFELIAELEMENSNYVVVAPIDEENGR